MCDEDTDDEELGYRALTSLCDEDGLQGDEAPLGSGIGIGIFMVGVSEVLDPVSGLWYL